MEGDYREPSARIEVSDAVRHKALDSVKFVIDLDPQSLEAAPCRVLILSSAVTRHIFLDGLGKFYRSRKRPYLTSLDYSVGDPACMALFAVISEYLDELLSRIAVDYVSSRAALA